MNERTLTLMLLLFAATLSSAPASAQQDDACWMTAVNEELQYLRRLSLDLRGYTPSLEEYETVRDEGRVPDAMIRDMLDSDGFVHQMREYHRELLKMNISDQRYVTLHWALRRTDDIWSLTNNSAMRYRGSRELRRGFGLCADVEVTPDDPIVATRTAANGERYPVDGWVWVTPYWDPSTRIKVCAFDAQTERLHDPSTRRELYFDGGTGAAFGGDVPSQTVNCEENQESRGCGCGPNLEWCINREASESMISRMLVEQGLVFLDSIVRRDRPYTDVILASDLPFNGPVAHYINHWSFKADSGLPFLADRDQGYPIPDLDFAVLDEWSEVDRGDGHAGILTSPFFLLKYATNRGRAAAFYDMFMCKTFVPPTEGLPPAGDPSNEEPNLTRRAGCASCHRTVEPMAAHWGLFSENGLVKLGMETTDNVLYPNTSTYLEACDIGSCDHKYPWVCVNGDGGTTRLCRNSYQLEPVPDASGDAYQGSLKALVFADVDPDADSNQRCSGPGCGYEANIYAGPDDLAQDTVDSGTFASCVVDRMWTRWIGRGMTDDERRERLPWIADDFAAGGYDIKTLVHHFVTSPDYRSPGLGRSTP